MPCRGVYGGYEPLNSCVRRFYVAFYATRKVGLHLPWCNSGAGLLLALLLGASTGGGCPQVTCSLRDAQPCTALRLALPYPGMENSIWFILNLTKTAVTPASLK